MNTVLLWHNHLTPTLTCESGHTYRVFAMIAKGDHTHHTPLGPYMGLQRPGASRPPAAGTPQCEQDEEEDDRDEVSAMEQTPPKATVKKGKKFSSALLAKPDPKMMWSVKTLSPVTERMASLHRTTSVRKLGGS